MDTNQSKGRSASHQREQELCRPIKTREREALLKGIRELNAEIARLERNLRGRRGSDSRLSGAIDDGNSPAFDVFCQHNPSAGLQVRFARSSAQRDLSLSLSIVKKKRFLFMNSGEIAERVEANLNAGVEVGCYHRQTFRPLVMLEKVETFSGK